MDYPELNTLLILGIIFLVAVSIGMLVLLIRARFSPIARIILSIILVVSLPSAVVLAFFYTVPLRQKPDCRLVYWLSFPIDSSVA